MKQAISPESLSDPGHSSSPQENESNTPSGSRVKSAAMFGLALSVGASGALISTAEASANVSAPEASATTQAFSSDDTISATEAATEAATESVESAQTEIVAYHTVESGESLWQIAQQHRVGLRELKSANALPPETAIRVGQVLRVPSASASSERSVGEASAETVAQADAGQTQAGQITFETVSPAPTLMAQSLEQADADETAQPSALAATESLVTEQEVTPQPAAVEIEIADASVAVEAAQSLETEPVVTALASPGTSPGTFSSYQIQAGDTLASIASSLGTTPQEIISANNLANPNVIITGTTLRVPTPSEQPVAKRTENLPDASSSAGLSGTASERLAHLQNTAVRPEAARILGEMRSASPAEPASVGGEAVTQQDVIGASSEQSQSDPFVENLLEDVQAVRETDVSVSEAAASDRPSLLSRSAERRISETVDESEQVALAPAAPTASPELLAAAPLSPDAYIPAQRPAAGQVVSPDMPILPEADEFLPEAPDRFDGYVWPTQGTVTSGYGWRWGRMHRGVDVAGPVGTPVVAAAMGVVEQAGWNSGGYGNLVEIRHPDGSMTRYAHNNRLNVSAGQTVRQGQQIAEMGSTGYSTGPHLHFEVHVSGQGAVNPVAYLPGR